MRQRSSSRTLSSQPSALWEHVDAIEIFMAAHRAADGSDATGDLQRHVDMRASSAVSGLQ